MNKNSKKLTREKFKELDLENKLRTLYFFNGEAANGKIYYYYMLMKNADYLRFMELVKSGKDFGQITQYGEIVAHGEGKEPPEDVKKSIEAKYKPDEDFDINVQKEMNANIAEFTKQGKVPGRDGKWMVEKLVDKFIDEWNKQVDDSKS